ncbi:hypothetical protein A9Q78_07640 [Methylophaga sp. 41_12_T18]|nr:hypothetical protein A9Q78_07640 [Methylophaga sp. 41_12_T18]
MKSNIIKLVIVAPMLFGSINVMAAGSSQHLSKASAHSAQAIAQTSVAGVKIVSGVVAVPLMIVGGIGNASGQAGEALWNEATTPIGEPLAITDEILTTRASPEQAMKSEGE